MLRLIKIAGGTAEADNIFLVGGASKGLRMHHGNYRHWRTGAVKDPLLPAVFTTKKYDQQRDYWRCLLRENAGIN